MSDDGKIIPFRPKRKNTLPFQIYFYTEEEKAKFLEFYQATLNRHLAAGALIGFLTGVALFTLVWINLGGTGG